MTILFNIKLLPPSYSPWSRQGSRRLISIEEEESRRLNRNYEPWLIINLIVSEADKVPSINNLQCSHLMF